MVRIKKTEIKKELTVFQREFRRYLTTFITGAFSFVAALLWRDAIQSIIEKYKDYIQTFLPLKEGWAVQFFMAFVVTIVAVVAIVVISKLLRVEND